MTAPRFGYLGPEGTFTESALRTLDEAADAELVAYPTVPSALDGVRRGEVAAAMVPIENSVEGAVTATLDELATGEPLMVTGEVALPVAFALLARPGTTLASVRRVGTHPHALAQCRRWLRRTLPDAALIAATSTAAAAATVAAGDSTYDAALTAPVAVEHYPLEVLAEGIADNPRAVTRFVLVGRPATPPEPTGADKTTLVAYIRDDRPGALLEILTEFAVRGVNLTRIESRPTGDRLGDYHFSIDCEGHVADARVGEALMGLRRVCADLRFLGSYPRADKVAPTVRPGTSSAEFADAQAWLARIRAGNA